MRKQLPSLSAWPNVRLTHHRTCVTPQLGLQTDIDMVVSTGCDVLTAHIYNAFDNGNARGGFDTVTLATAHAAKGLEWGAVYIVEPSNMMLARILAEGGIAAEDETHIKHVMVSRARNRLIYSTFRVSFSTPSSRRAARERFSRRAVSRRSAGILNLSKLRILWIRVIFGPGMRHAAQI
jgi:hypothetical protein